MSEENDGFMTNPVLAWWSFLCAAALLNVVAWLLSARLLSRRRMDLPASVYTTRRVLLWLSAAYVLGCGFRSVLPMIDVPRLCLHDTAISRIAIGRSVATIAELCFAAQFVLLLLEAGRNTGRRAVVTLAPLLFLLIVAAELFSWSAVLTRNFLLHAVENSLWTAGAALALIAFASLRPRVDAGGARFLTAALVCGVGYLAFMTLVDIPTYIARWQAALDTGWTPLPLREGLRETLALCTVARDWSAWHDDVAWLTLYFTTAVWISIALPHAPALAPIRQRHADIIGISRGGHLLREDGGTRAD